MNCALLVEPHGSISVFTARRSSTNRARSRAASSRSGILSRYDGCTVAYICVPSSSTVTLPRTDPSVVVDPARLDTAVAPIATISFGFTSSRSSPSQKLHAPDVPPFLYHCSLKPNDPSALTTYRSRSFATI